MQDISEVGRECRFAIHIASKHPDVPDIHMVKEQIHYTDGKVKPNLRFVSNFKRPFWITKPNKRTYKQKKEYEHIDNLLTKEVTQSKLRDEVARALDRGYSRDSLRDLASSPYLYGTDITSTALIKRQYQLKYPNLTTPFTVAAFDIETDVVNGTKEAIIATIVFQDKVFIAVQKNFVQGFSCLNDRVQAMAKKYINESLDKFKMSIELYEADGVIDLIRSVFVKAHEWKPDFLAIWNMDFDIPEIIRMMEDNHVNPEDILCDPSVPKHLRICKYKQGSKKKTTASGKVIPINPAAQWHTLQLTASFYVIDAMCSYKHIRLSEQEESSYSLDNILNVKLGMRKLTFEEADNYQGLKWHQFMQTEYKIQYMIYNIWDCIAMLELDHKTKDLSFTLPVFSATSDFDRFKSQPKRIADALYYECLDKGYVLATVGKSVVPIAPDVDEDTVVDEDAAVEGETLSLKGWIVTLPAHMSVLGINCVSEDPMMRSGIRTMVFDSDATAAYPTATSVCNVSKGTTKRELISIENIDEELFRMQNLNLVLGTTNSLEYSVEMFKAPKPHVLLDLFINS